MSDIRHRAEQILYGNTLDDKLVCLKGLTDHAPGQPIATPELPGRPPELGFHTSNMRHPFPKPAHLNDERQRAVVLHHFANHELLALELMALTLLRFPDAPSSFRKTLIQTMADEQKHLRLYCGRMTELGIHLGDVPVNRFFWDALAHCADPLTFTCGMSLTFEQANLDFSLFWKDAFMNAGDIQTATLLETVYEDEIRHVRVGYQWLKKFKPQTDSDWKAYISHLYFPLSPSRAKGKTFCRGSRERAGLPTSFIDQISVYRHSKGRSPALLWFNPDCDERAGQAGHTPRKAVLEMQKDLSHLPLFWAQTDDIVLVHKQPPLSLLDTLQRLKFPLPEFLVWSSKVPLSIQHPRLRELRPWGWAPNMDTVVGPVRARVHERSPTRWNIDWGKWYSKANSQDELRAWARAYPTLGESNLATAGITCHSMAEIPGEKDRYPILLKAPYSTSGRHRLRLTEPEYTQHQEQWIRKTIQRQGAVVAEPLLHRLADFSIHLQNDQKPCITRFFTDASGKYRATLVNSWDEGLPFAWKRYLHTADGSTRWLYRVATSLKEHFSTRTGDFPGVLSIDAMLHLQNESLQFKPIVEINPRMTMSRLALAFRPKIAAHCVALWIMGTSRECIQAGFPDMRTFQNELSQHNPLHWSEQGLIQSGVLWLTPPESSSWACLWTGASLSDALCSWKKRASKVDTETALTQWVSS